MLKCFILFLFYILIISYSCQDNYDRMCAETRPKKIRKKAKPSAMTRPSKRGKKKKRLQRLSETTVSDDLPSQSLQVPDSCGML